jgi:transcriptional antiterminator RfaH
MIPPATTLFPPPVDAVSPGGTSAAGVLRWFVAHTKPRCEKKLLACCQREKMAATLPCYSSVHKYRGKSVVFEKPLFPGYVFVQINAQSVSGLRQNDLVANLLAVHDQAVLEQQLREIMLALEAGLEVRLAPTIGEGMRVRIKSGPLRGVEGWVEKRHGMDTILLRLDFINQAAAVRLDAQMLELV